MLDYENKFLIVFKSYNQAMLLFSELKKKNAMSILFQLHVEFQRDAAIQ